MVLPSLALRAVVRSAVAHSPISGMTGVLIGSAVNIATSRPTHLRRTPGIAHHRFLSIAQVRFRPRVPSSSKTYQGSTALLHASAQPPMTASPSLLVRTYMRSHCDDTKCTYMADKKVADEKAEAELREKTQTYLEKRFRWTSRQNKAIVRALQYEVLYDRSKLKNIWKDIERIEKEPYDWEIWFFACIYATLAVVLFFTIRESSLDIIGAKREVLRKMDEDMRKTAREHDAKRVRR